MKNLCSILTCAIFALTPFMQTGCLSTTAAQYASDAFYVAGSDFAVWKLASNPSAGKTLDDLAAALPKIPLGQVSAFDLGVLSGELGALKKAENATASTAAETAAFDRIIALIGNVSMIANKGGNPTAITGAISAQAQSFANGITYGRQFNAGRTSVAVLPPTVIVAKGKLRIPQSAASSSP
jgi:hypothetical protein